MLFVTLCLESQPGGRFNVTRHIRKWRLTTTPSPSNFKSGFHKPPTNKVMAQEIYI